MNKFSPSVPPSLCFAPGTPQAAKEVLNILWSYHLPDAHGFHIPRFEIALIRNVAEHGAMKGVWEALDIQGESAGALIHQILKAARRALMESSQEYSDYYGTGYGIADVIRLASQLRKALWETREYIEFWPQTVPYDKFMDFLKEAQWIERVYEDIADRRRGYWASCNYPRSRKAHGADAAEIAFSKMMSYCFQT